GGSGRRGDRDRTIFGSVRSDSSADPGAQGDHHLESRGPVTSRDRRRAGNDATDRRGATHACTVGARQASRRNRRAYRHGTKAIAMTQPFDDAAEWNAVAAAWQRQDAHPPVDPRTLEARIRRDRTMMRRVLVVEIAFSLAVVAFTLWNLIRESDSSGVLIAV